MICNLQFIFDYYHVQSIGRSDETGELHIEAINAFGVREMIIVPIQSKIKEYESKNML